MFNIGPFRIESQAALAPMAGVSDLPHRELCSRYGAAYVVNEMVTSDISLWHTQKTQSRLAWGKIHGPRIMQIAGAEPALMAEAAAAAVANGAQIIDINMGCPVKKVCSKAAGSALLRDEVLVQKILNAVVNATSAPTTLKIRTGWDADNKNAVTIARLAQAEGIQALTVHGRTRACRFKGEAEYDTIAAVAAEVDIPVIANGDIDSPQKAAAVLQHTKAAGVLIGRASQGNPWLFRAINEYLANGTLLAKPNLEEVRQTLIGHIRQIHAFYGNHLGPRIARKHFGWYLCSQFDGYDVALIEASRQHFNTLLTLQEQLTAVCRLIDRLHQLEDQAA